MGKNIKLTVKTEYNTRYCILSDREDMESQLAQVMAVQPGYGFCVRLYRDAIRLVDYFHGETRAEFPILSREETDLPVSLSWTIL